MRRCLRKSQPCSQSKRASYERGFALGKARKRARERATLLINIISRELAFETLGAR